MKHNFLGRIILADYSIGPLGEALHQQWLNVFLNLFIIHGLNISRKTFLYTKRLNFRLPPTMRWPYIGGE
jgi:hypothetical protein